MRERGVNGVLSTVMIHPRYSCMNKIWFYTDACAYYYKKHKIE